MMSDRGYTQWCDAWSIGVIMYMLWVNLHTNTYCRYKIVYSFMCVCVCASGCVGSLRSCQKQSPIYSRRSWTKRSHLLSQSGPQSVMQVDYYPHRSDVKALHLFLFAVRLLLTKSLIVLSWSLQPKICWPASWRWTLPTESLPNSCWKPHGLQ